MLILCYNIYSFIDTGGNEMFEDTEELAENKLLLLYIFSKIKYNISNIQITQIILENNFINYFTLQQYLSELISSDFLCYIEHDGKQRISITKKGLKVLDLFKNRLSENKIAAVDNYLEQHEDEMKKEITVVADYTIEKKDNFIVDLKVIENNIPLINIKLNVASNKQARDICSKWKNNSSELYNKIVNILIKE